MSEFTSLNAPNIIQIEDELSQLNLNALNNDVINVMKLAFQNNGYVAGGFAIDLFRIVNPTLFSEHVRDFWDYVALNSNFMKYHIRDVLTGEPIDGVVSHARSLSDIDLWFHSEASRRNFMSMLQNVRKHQDTEMIITSSVANFADEIILTNRNRNAIYARFQCVKTFEGRPEELIRKFDLVNSMIAYNNKQFLMHKDWLRLEQTKTLDILQYNVATLWRARKYMTRKKYFKFTDRTSNILKESLIEAIEYLAKTSYDDIAKEEIKEFTLSPFKQWVITIVKKEKNRLSKIEAATMTSGYGPLSGCSVVVTPIQQPERSIADIANSLLEVEKSMICKMSTADILELTAYQKINEDEYSFLKTTLMHRMKQNIFGVQPQSSAPNDSFDMI